MSTETQLLRLIDVDEGETLAYIVVPKDKVGEFRKVLIKRDISIEEEKQHVFETVDEFLEWWDED